MSQNRSAADRSAQAPWKLIRTLGPATRAVTLEQAKVHLRLSPHDTTHDDLLVDALDAAIESVEHDCEKVLVNQTFHAIGLRFPTSDAIPLDRDPVESVSKIEYLDPEFQKQTLDPATYVFDKARRAIFPAPEQAWPTVGHSFQSITVEFVAGYGADGSYVPASLIQAVLLMVSHHFYGIEIAETYANAIRPHRRRRYP